MDLFVLTLKMSYSSVSHHIKQVCCSFRFYNTIGVSFTRHGAIERGNILFDEVLQLHLSESLGLGDHISTLYYYCGCPLARYTPSGMALGEEVGVANHWSEQTLIFNSCLNESISMSYYAGSGDYRLVTKNGTTSRYLTAGRVDVFYVGRWGTICNDGFSSSDAAALCHILTGSSTVLAYGPVGSTGLE